jgi:iron complex transport system ATP-binding protein
MSEEARTTKNGTEGPSELVGDCVVVGYGDGEPLIQDESVVAKRGAVTALVGPNGSGKSTLLRVLADQMAPEDGTVLVDGEEAHTLDKKEFARKVGLLSQRRRPPGGMTVEELVVHGRYPHRGFFESLTDDDREAVERALDLAGIDRLRDRELGSLSGGQRQLARIAMVLAQDTDVLLLDEPTTFLDLRHRLEVMSVVEALRDEGETTVVVVLHDINQAVRHSDRVVALKDGAVRARGPPEEVVTEETLEDVFGVEATVEESGSGLRVEPLCPTEQG